MIGLGNNLAFSLFVPKQGLPLVAYIVGAVIIGLVFLFALMRVPPRYRKPLVIGITFVMGWFYMLEFFIPGSSDTSFARGKFLSAESQLYRAQQNVASIAQHPKIAPGLRAERIRLAQSQLDRAIADMKAGQDSVAAIKPGLQKQYDAAAANAEDFARAHNLNKNMLDRTDGGKGQIQDIHTKTLTQRMNNVDAAMSQADAVLKGDGKTGAAHTVWGLDEIRSQLTETSTADISQLGGQIANAAENAGLAAGAISSNFLTGYKDVIGSVSEVIGGFTLGLGILNLLSIHFRTIIRRRLGWPSSIGFYLAFIAIIVFGLMQKYATAGNASWKLGDAGYNFLFNGALAQLQSTMFALVAFYIVSAAYRAFRVRSGEAAFMMAAAILVMLAFVPIGSWLTHGLHGGWASLRLENIRGWILEIPNAAAQRGMAFGIGIGALAMGLRLWLSLERGSYFDKQM